MLADFLRASASLALSRVDVGGRVAGSLDW